MAVYKVQIGDQAIRVEADENASEEDILAMAQRQYKTTGAFANTREALEPFAAGALGAVKGLTANFDDEIFAGLRSVVPLGETGTNIWNGATFRDAFNRNVKVYRDGQKFLEARNPKVSAAGEMVGAIGGGLTLAGAGARLAARGAPRLVSAASRFASANPAKAGAASGVTGGATGGAVSGYGSGETPEAREKAAMQGGALGGILGGAGGLVISSAGPALARYFSAVTGGRNQEEAARQLAEALKKDGFDISTEQGFEDAMIKLEAFDPKRMAMLADIGVNVRNRVAAATRYPSAQQQPSLEKIAERSRGQSGRLVDDVKNTVAPPSPTEPELYGPNMYRGGPPTEEAGFYTPDRRAAEEYADLRMAPGAVTENQVRISQPATQSDVMRAARAVGYDDDDMYAMTPASLFDKDLFGDELVEALRSRLQREGYDGAYLTDITPAGAYQTEITAAVPFSRTQTSTLSDGTNAKRSGRTDITKMSDELIAERMKFAKNDRERAFWRNVAAEKSRLKVIEKKTYQYDMGYPVTEGLSFIYKIDPNGPDTPDNLAFRGYLGNPRGDGTYKMDIFNPDGYLRRDRPVGTATMKGALKDMRRDLPQVERIKVGARDRVTGARAKARDDAWQKYYDFDNTPEAKEFLRVGDLDGYAEARQALRERAAMIEENTKGPDIDMKGVTPSPPLHPGGRVPREVVDEKIQALLKDPQGTGAVAVREAIRLARADRSRRKAMGEDLSLLPELRMEGPYTYELVDEVKKYLDSAITRLQKGVPDSAFAASDMHNIIRFRNDIRNLMKESNPEYREYLQNYGDSSAMINALEEGVDYRKLPADLIEKQQGERSKGAQEMYRVGAARANVDRLEKASDRPGASMNVIAENKAERDRLKSLGMTDEELNELFGARAQEMELQQLYDVTQSGGVPAAVRRQAEDEATGLPSINVPYNVGNPVGWGGAAARKLSDALMLRRTSGINEALLPQALTSGVDAEIVLENLQKGVREQLARNRSRVGRSAVTGYSLGVPIGGAVAINPEEY